MVRPSDTKGEDLSDERAIIKTPDREDKAVTVQTPVRDNERVDVKMASRETAGGGREVTKTVRKEEETAAVGGHADTSGLPDVAAERQKLDKLVRLLLIVD